MDVPHGYSNTIFHDASPSVALMDRLPVLCVILTVTPSTNGEESPSHFHGIAGCALLTEIPCKMTEGGFRLHRDDVAEASHHGLLDAQPKNSSTISVTRRPR
jgi:hypothetical protein